MVGFEKALGAVKVIKDQIQYRSQSLLNLARDYFRLFKILRGSRCFLVPGAKKFAPGQGFDLLKKIPGGFAQGMLTLGIN